MSKGGDLEGMSEPERQRAIEYIERFDVSPAKARKMVDEY